MVYSGKSGQSKLKVQGEDEIDTEENSGTTVSDASIVLKDGQARVSIQKAQGSGIIKASQQTYRQIMPTTFDTRGNVDVYLDHMPKPTEIPVHDDGDFRITVNMDRNYINSSSIDYGDVLFFMHMNNHKWENRNAAFIYA